MNAAHTGSTRRKRTGGLVRLIWVSAQLTTRGWPTNCPVVLVASFPGPVTVPSIPYSSTMSVPSFILSFFQNVVSPTL